MLPIKDFCSNSIGPLYNPVTWYSGTFNTKQLAPVHLDLPLFWKSHCVIFISACVILHFAPDRTKDLLLKILSSCYLCQNNVPTSVECRLAGAIPNALEIKIYYKILQL